MRKVKSLCDKEIFSSLRFKLRKNSKHFSINYQLKTNTSKNSENSNCHIYIGFILPKKYVKRSVDRNLVKRWCRELVRHSTKILYLIVKVKVHLPFFGKRKDKYFTELGSLINEI